MREVVDDPVESLSPEEEVLAHLLCINFMQYEATPLFQFPHIPYPFSVLPRYIL